MNKKIRNILIIIFGILFFLGCPLAIFYSQGYRFDFRNKKFIKTGGLFLKTVPRQTDVYLDGKFKKKTDILFGEAFLNNLIPKKYEITIKKEGYFSWEKNLEVKSGTVTEAKEITLFPKNLGFSSLTSDVQDFTFSPDRKYMILKKMNKEKWELNVFNLDNNTQRKLLTETDLEQKIVSNDTRDNKLKLLKIIWSHDSKKILLKTEIEKKTKYFIKEIAQPEKEISTLPLLDNAKEASFNPNNTQELFFIKSIKDKDELFWINYQKNPSKNLPKLFTADVVTYKINNNKIYWLTTKGLLYGSDSLKNTPEVLNTVPLSFKNNSTYIIDIIKREILLRENNILYKLNSNSGNFEKINIFANQLKTSPDSKKLAAVNDHEIQIIFLEDIPSQPQRKRQEKVFLARFSKKINNIFWLNDNYLLFNTGDKIKISEVDNRDSINIISIEKFENPEIFFNESNKKLYILSSGTLYVSRALF